MLGRMKRCWLWVVSFIKFVVRFEMFVLLRRVVSVVSCFLVLNVGFFMSCLRLLFLDSMFLKVVRFCFMLVVMFLFFVRLRRVVV